MRNKICVALIAVAISMMALQMTAMAQSDNPAGKRTVTLNLENADLRYAVKLLFSSAGLNYTIDAAAAGSVTLSLSDVPFKTALESVLRSTQNSRPLTYRVEDGVYNIFPKAEEKVPEPDPKDNLIVDVPKQRFAKINLNFADAEDIANALGGTVLRSRFGGSIGAAVNGSNGLNGFGNGFNSSNGSQGSNGLGQGSGFNNFGNGFNSGIGSGTGNFGNNNGNSGRRR